MTQTTAPSTPSSPVATPAPASLKQVFQRLAAAGVPKAA